MTVGESVACSIAVFVLGCVLSIVIYTSHLERMKELELKPCIEQVEQK